MIPSTFPADRRVCARARSHADRRCNRTALASPVIFHSCPRSHPVPCAAHWRRHSHLSPCPLRSNPACSPIRARFHRHTRRRPTGLQLEFAPMRRHGMGWRSSLGAAPAINGERPRSSSFQTSCRNTHFECCFSEHQKAAFCGYSKRCKPGLRSSSWVADPGKAPCIACNPSRSIFRVRSKTTSLEHFHTPAFSRSRRNRDSNQRARDRLPAMVGELSSCQEFSRRSERHPGFAILLNSSTHNSMASAEFRANRSQNLSTASCRPISFHQASTSL
jgi:hypothetical protein